MNRRRYLAVGVTSALTTFAGCLGDDGSDDSGNGDDGTNESGNGETGNTDSGNGDTGTNGSANGEDGTTETGNGDDETTNSSDENDGEETDTGDQRDIDSMCEIDNEVDELTIVSCESQTQGDQYLVSATIRNDGDQETSLYDYEKKAWIFESNETIGRGIQTSQSFDVENFDIAPGDTGSITFTLVISPEDITTDDIQRYVVELGCWSATDAVYCPA